LDNIFIVEFPEFERCKTHGETYEDGVKNGKEVLDLLIESFKKKADHFPNLK
jgi:antitoxin HicB